MDDLAPAYEALQKAHAAGDTANAQKLADYIRTRQTAAAKESASGRVEPIAATGAEQIAETVAGWFKPQEQKELTLGGLGGAAGGGAIAGAVGGAVLPKVLEKVGSVIPGPAGRAVKAVGEGMGALPAKERIARGAGGGAAMGAAEETMDAFGAPKALTLAASLGAGGVGETAASFLSSTGSKLARFVANASYGNVAGASRALGGMLSPNKALNEATATKLQQKLFGNKTESYVDTLVGSDHSIAVQEAMRKVDPSLAGIVAPASQVYRERMFDGVTAAVKQGKGFSSTPEFGQFKEQLRTQVQLGNVSQAEASGLLQTLQADRLKNPEALKQYAKTVDDRIREWGRQLEGAPSTGAKAVSDRVASDIRGKLQQAYNGYTERLGLGQLEQKYRAAYSQEMVAEAKDKFPNFLADFENAKDRGKLVRNLIRDPEGKPFIQKTLARHMAQQEPGNVVQEFERQQKVLVQAGLVQPADLKELREGVAAVKRTADKGLQLRMGQQIKQMLLLAMTRQAGVQAGAAAGQPQEQQQ